MRSSILGGFRPDIRFQGEKSMPRGIARSASFPEVRNRKKAESSLTSSSYCSNCYEICTSWHFCPLKINFVSGIWRYPIKLRGYILHFGKCFTIWLITCYWNKCLWLQVLMYLFFHPVAAFNIFSKWKLSKSQMLRILLSAHCFAKSEPSPKTLFYFSADHCSLVLSKLCCKINTFPNSILCLTFSNISSCQS